MVQAACYCGFMNGKQRGHAMREVRISREDAGETVLTRNGAAKSFAAYYGDTQGDGGKTLAEEEWSLFVAAKGERDTYAGAEILDWFGY